MYITGILHVCTYVCIYIYIYSYITMLFIFDSAGGERLPSKCPFKHSMSTFGISM